MMSFITNKRRVAQHIRIIGLLTETPSAKQLCHWVFLASLEHCACHQPLHSMPNTVELSFPMIHPLSLGQANQEVMTSCDGILEMKVN